tara:strand:+ start:3051 stop:4043 length:993 start_codon:yes stop_codon:yes gene_type:complete
MSDGTENTFDMDSAVNEIGAGLGLDSSDDSSDDRDIADVVADDLGSDTEVAADTQTEEQSPVVEDSPPPKSWAKETHEIWKTLTPDARKQVELREKQVLDGLSQYKEHNDFGKSMRDAFAPYKAMIQAQGVDEVKATQFLLNAHYKLSSGSPQERAAHFAQLAKSYNIDLPQGQTEQQQIDPAVKSLQDELGQIRSALTQREQADLSAARNRVSSEVNAFAETAPYFDEVADDTAAFIQSGNDLKTAYDKAVWANPVTRAKEQARLFKESEAKLREKGSAEAAAAKKASSTNVRTRDTGRSPTGNVGKLFGAEHEAEMRETVRKAASRTH